MRGDSAKFSMGGNDMQTFGNGSNNFAENSNRPKHYFSNYQNLDNQNPYQFNNSSFKSDFDFGDNGFNRQMQPSPFNNYGSNIDFKFSPNGGSMMNPRMKVSFANYYKSKHILMSNMYSRTDVQQRRLIQYEPIQLQPRIHGPVQGCPDIPRW